MPHHVYNTRGIILSSRPLREADKLFQILTPDLGLVAATARGVRSERSKLRGILQDLSLVDVSLVRGKNYWRLTTATLDRSNAQELRAKKKHLEALARVSSLLENLIRGEEKHQDLFEILQTSIRELFTQTDVNGWEIFTVANLLYHLGYLALNDVPQNEIEAAEKRKHFVSVINNGIQLSGLL